MKYFRLLFLFCALVASANAQVFFTVTAVAIADQGLGFTVGDTVVFTYTLKTPYQGTLSSVFSSTTKDWEDEYVSDDPLWSNFEMTGTSGAYSRPSTPYTAPFSYVRVNKEDGINSLSLVAGAEGSVGLGLVSPSAQLISSVSAHIEFASDFSYAGGYVNPSTYFAAYSGIYLPSNSYLQVDSASGDFYTAFDITGLTISVVPEEETYAMVCGASVFGFILYRRKMRKVNRASLV